MKSASLSLLQCIVFVMLMTEMVLGAPFRHEWSGVVIDPPPGWRMEVRHGFVPYYYLRLQVAKEDEEEALRRWKARSDDDEAYEAELNDLAQGQTCSIKFSDVQENEQSLPPKIARFYICTIRSFVARQKARVAF